MSERKRVKGKSTFIHNNSEIPEEVPAINAQKSDSTDISAKTVKNRKKSSPVSKAIVRTVLNENLRVQHMLQRSPNKRKVSMTKSLNFVSGLRQYQYKKYTKKSKESYQQVEKTPENIISERINPDEFQSAVVKPKRKSSAKSKEKRKLVQAVIESDIGKEKRTRKERNAAIRELYRMGYENMPTMSIVEDIGR